VTKVTKVTKVTHPLSPPRRGNKGGAKGYLFALQGGEAPKGQAGCGRGGKDCRLSAFNVTFRWPRAQAHRTSHSQLK